MKNSMQEMTIEDLNGHWKTKDGNCHIWIHKDEHYVQLFANQKLILEEPLAFQYLQHENIWAISELVSLFMIFPEDNSIVLKVGEDKVEFVR